MAVVPQDTVCVHLNSSEISFVFECVHQSDCKFSGHEQVLFNDTIMHNIAYGRPNATQEQVIQAAKQAVRNELLQCEPRPHFYASLDLLFFFSEGVHI